MVNENTVIRLQQRNERLFEEMRSLNSLEPRLTLAKIIAFLMAIPVLVVPFIPLPFAAIIALHVVQKITTHELSQAVIGSFIIAFLLAIYWIIRPRLGRVPKESLSRAAYPTLYGLVDTVADALHTRRVQSSVLNNEYNASYRRVGFRRRVLLTLGMPLWATLNDEEKIALLAHEMAHGANGDFLQAFIFGSAHDMLVLWTQAATTSMRYRSVANLAMVPLAMVFLLVLHVFRRLMFHESRRAEYYADWLAAEIAGTVAVQHVLTKLRFATRLASMVAIHRSLHAPPETLFSQFQAYVSKALSNPDEMERVVRDHQALEAMYAWTHPPIDFRVRLLDAHPCCDPSLQFDAAQFDALEAEIRPYNKVAQSRLLKL